jgi:prepilin-type N-terminal cleavage/methylation domain-containing protein
MSRRSAQGFTLIELLIVVVIIGILAAIAIPKFSATREKAFISTMKSDLKNLASQQEIYYNDNFSYAATLAQAEAGQSDGVVITINENSGTGWSATATHAGMPAEQCGLYHGGAAAAGGSPAAEAGIVTCSM